MFWTFKSHLSLDSQLGITGKFCLPKWVYWSIPDAFRDHISTSSPRSFFACSMGKTYELLGLYRAYGRLSLWSRCKSSTFGNGRNFHGRQFYRLHKARSGTTVCSCRCRISYMCCKSICRTSNRRIGSSETEAKRSSTGCTWHTSQPSSWTSEAVWSLNFARLSIHCPRSWYLKRRFIHLIQASFLQTRLQECSQNVHFTSYYDRNDMDKTSDSLRIWAGSLCRSAGIALSMFTPISFHLGRHRYCRQGDLSLMMVFCKMSVMQRSYLLVDLLW